MIVMKNIFKVLLLICGILFLSNSSCQKDITDGIRRVEFNQPFELELNSKIILSDNNRDLMIELTSLTDSRCPVNVECIWAGNATAGLRFLDEQNSQATAVLCIGECKQFNTSDTFSLSLNNINYTVILKEVKPYPGTGEQSVKKAVLTIQKN